MTGHLGMMRYKKQRWTSREKKRFKLKSLFVSKFCPGPVLARKFVGTIKLHILVVITRKNNNFFTF